MAGVCCGIESEAATAAATKTATSSSVVLPETPASRASRRKRFALRQLKLVSDISVPFVQLNSDRRKRRRLDSLRPPQSTNHPTHESDGNVENLKPRKENEEEEKSVQDPKPSRNETGSESGPVFPKFGMTSVCGRRRDMEDAVSVHPSFVDEHTSFFGVFDGHGCSHVAMRCRERLHEVVREEKEKRMEWKETMESSFVRMDKELDPWSRSVASVGGGGNDGYHCRCEHRTPQSDAVGSTAVVAIVTPDKIIVSNCGDSRALLCRVGVSVPLTSDHKPDRPDELHRIEAAGGRVIYWDVPRVLGMLAMSRAIGDNYLKPYVIPDPEVTILDRTDEDECLILASDGLWDVVPNEMACSVTRMCLHAQKPPAPPVSPANKAAVGGGAVESSDKACSDASLLLTKLALARRSTDNVSVVVVDLRRKQHVNVDSNAKQ